MGDLTFFEKNELEKLFRMGTGYVLSFSNRTFQAFIADTVGKDIYANEYGNPPGSKANQLRAFWKAEPNHVVGRLLSEMIDHAVANDGELTNSPIVNNCRKTAKRLLECAPVPDLAAIAPNAVGRTFESLAKSVRDSIDNNAPEVGLDRLHTFVVKWVRELCKRRRISCDRDKPLHSCFGEYVKALRDTGLLQSDMAERILKSTISILEAFNRVRNDQSLAHDNELLGYDESVLIFNNTCAMIRFVDSVDAGIEGAIQPEAQVPGEEAPW